MDSLVIHCDFRENKSKVPGLLKEMGVRVGEVNLRTDYIVGNTCWVERKTVEDFVTSIADGRLFRQIQDLSRNCRNPLLLLEGGGLYSHGRVPENTIRGTMIWIALTKRVPILRTYNEHDTACMLCLLAKRYGKEVAVDNNSLQKRKTLSPWQQQMNVLIQIPGIGRQAAKDILNMFGSIDKMSAALDIELISLGRIGKKRLEAIRKVFPRKLE
jgi:DNA excision repair protein ERCC-4